MKKILIISFLLISNFTFGQILNVERFRLDKDTANLWLGNAGLGAALKKQQNNIYTFNANVNAVYLSEHHAYMTLNYFKFLRQEKTNLLSEGYTHFRLNLMRKKFFSYESFVQLQYDQGRGLEFREIYGSTVRLNLVSDDDGYFTMNTGFMYEREKWKGEVLRFAVDSAHAESQFIKSTTNATAKINLSESVYLFLVGYYQARPDRFFKPRLIADIQLQFRINRYLAFSTRYTTTFDALPVTKGNNFVYELNNSILIDFNP